MSPDEKLVQDFLDRHPLVYTEQSNAVREDLHELLRRARATAPKHDGLGDVMGKAEARIQEALARLAPPGSAVTPALLTKVNREVVSIVKSELVESGMSEPMATGLAAVLAAAMRVKPKGT